MSPVLSELWLAQQAVSAAQTKVCVKNIYTVNIISFLRTQEYNYPLIEVLGKYTRCVCIHIYESKSEKVMKQ